jgi:hypothetical protein
VSFSEAEKARIRRYLGFSQNFGDVDTRLEGQLDTLSPQEAEDQVREILAKLAAIDAKLQSAALSNLDLSRAEDVEWLGPDQLLALQNSGRMLINQLGIIFNIDMSGQPDYYGSSAGGGGVIPLG